MGAGQGGARVRGPRQPNTTLSTSGFGAGLSGRLTAPWQADKGEGTERKLWSMVNKGPYLGVQTGW